MPFMGWLRVQETQQLRAIEEITLHGKLWLQQTEKSNVWRVTLDDQSKRFLGTYVDYLLVSSSMVVEQVLAKIASIWECSAREILNAEKFWPGQHPPGHHEELQFCGLEIRMDANGLVLHQRSYTHELLKKHNVEKAGSLSAFAHEEITDVNDLQKARQCWRTTLALKARPSRLEIMRGLLHGCCISDPSLQFIFVTRS